MIECFVVGEVGFVEYEYVCKGDLFCVFVILFELLFDVSGVDECDDVVKWVFFLDFVVYEEGLSDGFGISKVCGFDEYVVEFFLMFY